MGGYSSMADFLKKIPFALGSLGFIVVNRVDMSNMQKFILLMSCVVMIFISTSLCIENKKFRYFIIVSYFAVFVLMSIDLLS